MNATYEKPVILANEMLAEGVYAASGDTGYTLKQTGAWNGNKQYDITLTNQSGKHVDSITVTVTVQGKVTSIGGNVTGTVNGTTATITCNNYGQGFAANASATFYMAVAGEGDFSLK